MRWCSGAPVALICLDLQRARLADPALADDAERTAAACRSVLEQARARRWPVLHAHRRESSPDAGRPIPGLEPLPTEPVFFHPGPSAFSHRAFRHAAHALGGPLALIGFSFADTALATAFAAVDRGLAVEVVRDAIAVGPRGAPGLGWALAGLAPLARAVDSHELFHEDAAAPAAANAP